MIPPGAQSHRIWVGQFLIGVDTNPRVSGCKSLDGRRLLPLDKPIFANRRRRFPLKDNADHHQSLLVFMSLFAVAA